MSSVEVGTFFLGGIICGFVLFVLIAIGAYIRQRQYERSENEKTL